MSKPPIVKGCPKCSFKTNKEEIWQEHFSIHQHESNFKPICFFCNQSLKNIKIYRKHITNCENLCEISKEVPKKSQLESRLRIELTWQCTICTEKL